MKNKIWFLIPSLLFFLGVPVFYIICLREPSLVVSPKTTYITAPLASDGKHVDYLAALRDRFEPKCKPEENGFRMVAEALGKSLFTWDDGRYWAKLCEKLDLDPNLAPTMKFENPDQFMKREFLLVSEKNDALEKLNETTDLRNRLRLEPWTEKDFPFMVRWIEENSPTLDLLVKATRQKDYFIPLIPQTDDLSEIYYSYVRQIYFVIGLEFRAMFRLGHGDWKGAWNDLLTCERIDNTLGYSNRNRCAGLAKVLPKNHALSEEDRKNCLADLENFAWPPSYSQDVLIARFGALKEHADYFERPPDKRNDERDRFINVNLILVKLNEYYDYCESIAKELGTEKDLAKKQKIIDDMKTFRFPAPTRCWLSNLVGKPITVKERSFEWVYYRAIPHLEFKFEQQFNREQTLAELRSRLSDSK